MTQTQWHSQTRLLINLCSCLLCSIEYWLMWLHKCFIYFTVRLRVHQPGSWTHTLSHRHFRSSVKSLQLCSISPWLFLHDFLYLSLWSTFWMSLSSRTKKQTKMKLIIIASRSSGKSCHLLSATPRLSSPAPLQSATYTFAHLKRTLSSMSTFQCQLLGLHVLKKKTHVTNVGVPQGASMVLFLHMFICYHMYEHLLSLMGSSCCRHAHHWPQNCWELLSHAVRVSLWGCRAHFGTEKLVQDWSDWTCHADV